MFLPFTKAFGQECPGSIILLYLMSFTETEILIVGGGVGGCAAALAACEGGCKVILTEESDWIGGQFTSQSTPPDEHGWIEEFGCTRSYRKFRESVREYYRENYSLTDAARNNPFLNPGDGWVSPLCAEPKVFLAVFEEILSEFVASGMLRILREHIAVAAETSGGKVLNVRLKKLQTGEEITVKAQYFIDATELGELLPLTNTEFVTGAESKAETNEPNAKESAEPHNSQAFSMCFAMSHHAGENHTIERPQNYEFWREFVPDLSPPWSGKLLSLTGLSPRTLETVHYNFQPNNEPNKAFAGLWTYRRILHAKNFSEGAFDSDITLVNYPQIDYVLDDLCNSKRKSEICAATDSKIYALNDFIADDRKSRPQIEPTKSREKMIAQAKQQSLSFLYYLQTELGFKELKLRGDVVGTNDGLAKTPYIRESRRIKAEFTVKEQHVSAKLREGENFAEKFPDSVGVGFYRIDLHPTARGDNYLDVEALPFQIPLGALIPKRVRNLLPACKNIGTTHITNGCYRLHPIEWNIGEAAGNLSAFCLAKNVQPRQVRNDKNLLREFQNELVKKGFELEWREDLKLDEGDPHRHAM
jgi:FAD dependent oxidoreductase